MFILVYNTFNTYLSHYVTLLLAWVNITYVRNVFRVNQKVCMCLREKGSTREREKKTMLKHYNYNKLIVNNVSVKYIVNNN